MQRMHLDSSSLTWAQYYPRQHWLDIEFRTGKLYRYFKVPAPVYRELLAAESKGRYFNSNIRNSFPYQDLSRSFAPLVLTASKTK